MENLCSVPSTRIPNSWKWIIWHSANLQLEWNWSRIEQPNGTWASSSRFGHPWSRSCCWPSRGNLGRLRGSWCQRECSRRGCLDFIDWLINQLTSQTNINQPLWPVDIRPLLNSGFYIVRLFEPFWLGLEVLFECLCRHLPVHCWPCRVVGGDFQLEFTDGVMWSEDGYSTFATSRASKRRMSSDVKRMFEAFWRRCTMFT